MRRGNGYAVSKIPNLARTQVKTRARFRCERCGVGSPNGQWHHRRRRGVGGTHCHCPCNGVWLCPTCHRWAHAHHTEAAKAGWIISAFVAEPYNISVATSWGPRHHHCDGTFTFTKEQS